MQQSCKQKYTMHVIAQVQFEGHLEPFKKQGQIKEKQG